MSMLAFRVRWKQPLPVNSVVPASRLTFDIPLGGLIKKSDAAFLNAEQVQTKALMLAGTAFEGDMFVVYADPVEANNGYYEYKNGQFVATVFPNVLINAAKDQAIAAAATDATSKANAAQAAAATDASTKATTAETNAKGYADANPKFKIKNLTALDSLDVRVEGDYNVSSDAIALALSAPENKAGLLRVRGKDGTLFRTYNIFNSDKEYFSSGNGGGASSGGFAWSVFALKPNSTAINASNAAMIAAIAAKPSINLFRNTELTSSGASIYQATVAVESGVTTLTMDTATLSSVFYEQPLDGKYFKIGATVTYSAEIFSDAVGSSSGDITIVALNALGATLATSTTSRGTTANTWHTISTSLVIPADTATIRTRFIRRVGNTVVKFRNPLLISDAPAAKMIKPLDNTSSVNQIIFVAKTGSDTNTGKSDSPFLTISRAVAAATDNTIVEIGGGEYRESVVIAKTGHIWLRSARGQRARIFGSDQLVVTKTSGFTQIYQAPLAAKPVGMGAPRGLPVIFEWGTPSKPILDDDRHFLQRGRVYRLPYTEMFEAATKADLDTVAGRGKWFWESGVIYFAATDGGDASAKRYEARVRPVLAQSLGSIHLTRIDGYFSSSYGMDFQGIYTKREDCRVFGSYHDGFSDDANITESYRDESGGNGNDGFNGTVTDYAGKPDEQTHIQGIYFDPYGHDNGDDGLSYHVRADATIYGGLMEYNTKADVVHVTGANCVCYNTVAQGTTQGFYTATAAPDGRTKTVMRCVGTRARKNAYSYRAADDSVLDLENAVAENPSVRGFDQSGAGAINAKNCKYTGDPAKIKSGNVIVTNDGALT